MSVTHHLLAAVSPPKKALTKDASVGTSEGCRGRTVRAAASSNSIITCVGRGTVMKRVLPQIILSRSCWRQRPRDNGGSSHGHSTSNTVADACKR